MNARFEVGLLGLIRGSVSKTQQTISSIDAVLQSFPSGYSYKGSVDSQTDLPENPEIGDMYTIKNESYAIYVWDGEQWLNLTPSISDEQIENLYG